jgi:hypothetical protein
VRMQKGCAIFQGRRSGAQRGALEKPCSTKIFLGRPLHFPLTLGNPAKLKPENRS